MIGHQLLKRPFAGFRIGVSAIRYVSGVSPASSALPARNSGICGLRFPRTPRSVPQPFFPRLLSTTAPQNSSEPLRPRRASVSGSKPRDPKMVVSTEKIAEEDGIDSENRVKRLAALIKTQKFSRKLNMMILFGYIMLFLGGAYYLSQRWRKGLEARRLAKKLLSEPYTAEELKRYNELAKELGDFPIKKVDPDDPFAPSEGLSEVPNPVEDVIPPASDTTSFYDEKAADYDKLINNEERIAFIWTKRRWLARHLEGDVLEVSCGTGRNIKYLQPVKISSITFLDSSKKMLEITKQKFREKFPKYQKVAFVVGKAEELVKLAGAEDGKTAEPAVKYDTIVETFGLCSHEDPVAALKNFQQLLKKDGRIVLVEHGRGTWGFINEYLDRKAKPRAEKWGCRWNLDIGEIVQAAGLDVVEEKRHNFGTTWCIVAKRKEDKRKPSEIGWIESWFGYGE